ncbi:MAG: response regulator transcription factor [Betaproteobacteria bacterium]|nr:response regulator transcription factor [Betaproteobacteria bacterium]
MNRAPLAHIVDDDEAIRDALAWLFQTCGVPSRAWMSGDDFLADYDPAMRGCVVLDVRMDGMSGPECLVQLLARGCTMPVIFLTGHADVPVAVSALKKGAFDFIEKPFNDNELVNVVIDALALDARRQANAAARAGTSARLASLSARERDVMERILAGKLNKVIADELDIAVRTVEVHRARIFEKMGVKSAVELAQVVSGGG